MNRIDYLNQIAIPEELDDVITVGIESGLKKGIRKNSKIELFKIQKLSRKIAIILGVIIVCSAVSITAYAVVKNLVEQRMENVSQAEKKKILDALDQSIENTDNYSRPLSEDEKKRMKQLAVAYQKGIFPKDELLQVQSVAEIEKDKVCYLGAKQYYYFPERLLTDEEILEIIDHNTKINYLLDERYREIFADEIAATQEKEKEGKKKLEDAEGITETQAIKIATEWLNKLYQVNIEDLQVNCRLDTELFLWKGYDALYVVDYSIAGYEYYDFYINAWNGNLIELIYSDADVQYENVTVEEMKKNIVIRYENALTFLTEKLGIDEMYQDSYCYYMENDGIIIEDAVQLVFVTKDKTAYVMRFYGDTIGIYEVMPYEAYQNYIRNSAQVLKNEWKEIRF